MVKYDKRFALKCDQKFLDQLARVAKDVEESESWVIRELVALADEDE